MSLARVLSDIAKERARQHQKWGQQDHEPERWLVILGEEFGETCQAAQASPDETDLFAVRDAARAYRAEMIQVAAVATAAVETLDRDLDKLENLIITLGLEND